jgi:GrpB-like predicted nucleotidyltransferase (UPF0157 family)
VQLTAVAPDQLGDCRLVPPLVDAEDAHALRADLGRQVAYERLGGRVGRSGAAHPGRSRRRPVGEQDHEDDDGVLVLEQHLDLPVVSLGTVATWNGARAELIGHRRSGKLTMAIGHSRQGATSMTDPAQPRRGSTTEEKLRAAWVTEPPKLTGKIQVVDYDPDWPRLFEREAERIRDVLGERVVQLEHVGSTSVPGLAAKPIIDVLLVVPDSSDEPAYVPDLEAAGYRLVIREPDWFEHRCLKGPDTNVNLHVYPPACPEIERYLLFRDRLRSHPEERAHYQRVKRELAERDWTYVQEYADAKTEVVEGIIARARGGPRA